MEQHVSESGKRGVSLEVFVVLAGVLAGLAFYFSPPATDGADRGAAANQAAGTALVIQQSSQVYDAIIRYLNDTGSYNHMTLDADLRTGIFSPYLESGVAPKANPGFFEHPEDESAKWYLSRQLYFTDGGDQWYGVVLPGVKKNLCQKLNAILHKDDLNAEPPLSVFQKDRWISGAVILDGPDLRLTRREGCAAASGGEYVFYRAMLRR